MLTHNLNPIEKQIGGDECSVASYILDDVCSP